MSDNDIRAAATELLASTEYARLTRLDRSEHAPWADLDDATRENWRSSFRRHVDVLVDAGWRPPARVITTVEELDTLPDTTIVRARFGTTAQKSEDAWEFPNEIGRYLGEIVDLPATVLWEDADA